MATSVEGTGRPTVPIPRVANRIDADDRRRLGQAITFDQLGAGDFAPAHGDRALHRRSAADREFELAEIESGEVRIVDQRVEQRVDAGHGGDARPRDGADQSLDVARIGNEHASSAHQRKGQQVRGQREDVIERQRREHAALFLGQIGRDHGAALQCVGDEIAMGEDRGFGDAGCAAGILQQSRRSRPRGGVHIMRAGHAAAGLLQQRDILEAPCRHRPPHICVGEIEHRPFDRRHEVAEARHHHMADLGLGQHRLELVGKVLHDHDGGGAAIVSCSLSSRGV